MSFVNGHMRRFLILQDKTTEELRRICEWLSIESEGFKSDLIDRLMNTDDLWCKPIKTQTISLRTRDEWGKKLPNAIQTYNRWKQKIVSGKGNTKEFGLLNKEGKEYMVSLRYAKCSIDTLNLILTNRWYLAKPSQEILISDLKLHPDRYEASIINKPSSNDNDWIMLHVKAA